MSGPKPKQKDGPVAEVKNHEEFVFNSFKILNTELTRDGFLLRVTPDHQQQTDEQDEGPCCHGDAG